MRITRITMPCLTMLGQLCPRPSFIEFDEGKGKFLLHPDGNGTGISVDHRTLGFLARLRLINRVPDADPARYTITNKGRGALKARATLTANYRCPQCPHPEGCHFDGQCLCHV